MLHKKCEYSRNIEYTSTPCAPPLANTSRGRVGRGGNASFLTFRLDHHDRQTDGLTDGPTDQRTDKAS